MKKNKPADRRPRPRQLPASLLADALGSLGKGVVVADRRLQRDGFVIRFANQSFCTMTDFSAAELQGLPHGKLHIDRSHLADLRRWLARPIQGRVFTGEGYLACKHGRRLHTAWTISPVSDARGRITHVTITYSDMTRQRRLQEELVHTQRLDAVGRLAGGVAHDFNNLLSVINGYCEILHSKPPVARQAGREIGEIHRAGLHAAGLVRQLLAFSRRPALDPKVVSLNLLVQDNADILSKLLQPDKSLTLALNASPDHVRVDPSQIQQVLLNLTINARDALSPGGRVAIHTEFREIKAGRNRRATDMPPGRYVLLSVNDNGAGMDDEAKAHLFEPFFTTKEQGKGTGLGLALVYGVVQQSGGYILVQSVAGRGSTFEIFLPVVNAPLDAQTAPLAPLPAASTHGRETIMLVESDAVVRKMVEGILTADGYRVLAADTAAQAHKLVGAHHKPVSLLIIDSGRTRTPSVKLVRDLLASRPTLRVLFTSSSEVSVIKNLPAKSQGTLTKPYALSSLLRAVRSLLDGQGMAGNTGSSSATS